VGRKLGALLEYRINVLLLGFLSPALSVAVSGHGRSHGQKSEVMAAEVSAAILPLLSPLLAFLVGLGFELGTLHWQSRCSTA
jgi:hypothetical protein